MKKHHALLRHTHAMPSLSPCSCRTLLLLLALLLALTGKVLAQRPLTATAATHLTDVTTLRIEDRDGLTLVWADNLLAGPIEARLDAVDRLPAWSDPALPTRASIPAGASVLLASLRMPTGSGVLRLQLTATPGSSRARPQDVAYQWPLANAAPIDQGFEGQFSHQDPENRYALDFATPEGTPVLAARAGVVMQVQALAGRTADALPQRRRANFIRILHDDGSMALYGHLAADGIWVTPGQRVHAGQRIGLSGNTGYSTAPHLHFVVQVNRGMQLVSIPFQLLPAPSAPPAGSAP